MIILADNEKGTLAFDGNELIIFSKIDDCPKVRLVSPRGGAVSFNTGDPTRMNEIGMIRVESPLNGLKGEMSFQLNDGGGTNDANMKKPLAFTWDKWVNQELPFRTDTLWSPNGMYFTQQQVDKNLVKYEARAAFDKINPVSADLVR